MFFHYLKIIIFFIVLHLSAGLSSAACTVSTSPVNFGTYDVFLVTPTDSTGTVTVTCDLQPPPTVIISIGLSPVSGSFNPRQMKHTAGPDVLNYNLFTKPNMLQIWGDGTSGTATVKKKVNRNKPWAATVYGRIPPGQDISAGQYTDMVTVTITF